MHDPRVGRFFAVDPLTAKYPFYSPYAFSGNRDIDAIEIEGKEPRIVVTDIITGYTYTRVYGAGNVREMVIPTYHAYVEYKNGKGETTTIQDFHVTRDGWFDMGTDKDNNVILYNRSSDPSPNNKKIYIQNEKPEQYGDGTPSFTLTPIHSPIPDEYNKAYFFQGEAEQSLSPDVIRYGGTSQGSQFHVGGVYIKIGDNKLSLGGTYGCYGIVDPSQVVKTEDFKYNTETMSPSNAEMIEFGEAIHKAQELQIEEHKKSAKTEVLIKPRNHEKVKTIPQN
jgi:hypothetical protein